MKAVPAQRPRIAAIDRTEGWGRIARAYTLDLAVSLVLVLAGARVWQMIAGTAPPNPWTDQLQQAVTRFTPFGLWEIYSDQLRMAVADSASHPGSAVFYNMLFGIRLLYDMLFAAGQTLWTIWQQTESVSDWLSLLGFTGILAASFVMLIAGGRLSLGRLILAVACSPLSAIGLFWIAQQTALDALDGFACYAAAAPWCLLCPVACTLYRVAFPGAEHSATVTCVDALRQPRLPGRRRRGIADSVSTVPRTRK